MSRLCDLGGQGSSFLIDALKKTGRRVHIRPDVAFAIDSTLADFPDSKSVAEFRKRSGYTLERTKTINDNLVAYLQYVNQRNAITVLARASRFGPFLTQNHVNNAVCVVRHPLHSYVSFIGHQHPEAGEPFGGFASEGSIKWYAEQWNRMAFDYLSSGNAIIRYEFMNGDVKAITSPNLAELLKNWTTGKRNHQVLSQEKEQLLRSLVSEHFYMIYSDWAI